MEKNVYKKHIYVYNWVTLLYSRDWPDIVNQLHFNEKIIILAFLVGISWHHGSSMMEDSKSFSMTLLMYISVYLFSESAQAIMIVKSPNQPSISSDIVFTVFATFLPVTPSSLKRSSSYLYSIYPYFRFYCISSLICGMKLVWLPQNMRILPLELHNCKVDNYLSGILKNNSMQAGSYKAHPPFYPYAHLVR